MKWEKRTVFPGVPVCAKCDRIIFIISFKANKNPAGSQLPSSFTEK